MSVLEDRVGWVFNTSVRPLVADALQCHLTGIQRGCIVLTWAAVCADLIEKTLLLEADGDGAAKGYAARIANARSEKNEATAVKLMQEVERDLLDWGRELELIDQVEHRALERIRQDRNLCAHPSLRPTGEFYDPSGEYARAHLVTALDALLVHPPTQGRKAMERFHQHVTEPQFRLNRPYLLDTYFGHVKSSTKRAILQVAAKHAVLELPSQSQEITAEELADRLAECLRVFADRDQPAARDALKAPLARLGENDLDERIRAFARLGDMELFWEAGGPGLESLFAAIVEGIDKPSPMAALAPADRTVLALVGARSIRERSARLGELFDALEADKATVIGSRPGEYFATLLPELVGEVWSFEQATNVVRNAVLPCAEWMDETSLRGVLEAWAGNGQCRGTFALERLASDLYRATVHLHPGDRPAWEAFLAAYESNASAWNYSLTGLKPLIRP